MCGDVLQSVRFILTNPCRAPTECMRIFQVLPGEVRDPIWLRCLNAIASWWSKYPASGPAVMQNVAIFFSACTLLWCAGCLYAASLPRLHGGKKLPETKEDLTYGQRLLAILTLGMVSRKRKSVSSCTALYEKIHSSRTTYTLCLSVILKHTQPPRPPSKQANHHTSAVSNDRQQQQ